ncbi:MAG: SyrP protein [Opitutae bacterium]|nr:SyrP protein [Opitutae bacterium]|tara:strand:- start:2607 stop:3590 length:984 start_codon:yes stop_codon:yes gene_type:complete
MKKLSSTVLKLDGQQEHYGKVFPLAYDFSSEELDIGKATAWASKQSDAINSQAAEHGAVLLRGLPLSTAEDFDAMVEAFGLSGFSYDESLSNAYRINYTKRVFSANEAPPEATIALHHEMAQTPIYPSKLFFFCQVAPEIGGATPICRSDVLWEKLVEKRPIFANDCRDKGLRYSNVMAAEADKASSMGRSWQSTFNADSREGAEARMLSLGYTWEWLPNGDLRATTPILPAVRDLGNGRCSFFNQLIAAFSGWKDARNDPSKAISFGDGSSLNPSDVERASSLADELIFDVPWQAGDLVLVDNYVAMHGRHSFTGTRKVMASLVAS